MLAEADTVVLVASLSELSNPSGFKWQKDKYDEPEGSLKQAGGLLKES